MSMFDHTRRRVIAGIGSLPVAAAFSSAAEADTTNSYLTELDALDRESCRLNTTVPNSAEYAAWDAWMERVYREIESLPPTPENVKIKARAVWSIVEGDVANINEGETTCCRLVRQVIAGLSGKA